jgi:hypothetical protein
MKNIDMGLVGDRAWWDIPLPLCPKCGGNLVWYEAGYVPGTRKCKTCRELYMVIVEDGRALLKEAVYGEGA